MTRRWHETVAIGLPLLLVAVACGGPGDGGTAEQAAAPTLDARAAGQGKQLYDEQSCSLCHGDNGEGNDNGPALKDLAPYWTVDRLVTYLEDPEAFRAEHPDFDGRRTESYSMIMPAYDYLSTEERRTLARWLMSR